MTHVLRKFLQQIPAHAPQTGNVRSAQRRADNEGKDTPPCSGELG